MTSAHVAVILGAMLAATTVARADDVDVVVQAGHQGRPASCAPNHVRACNIGASSADGREREIVWTPVVADAVAQTLRAAGYRVVRRPADYPEHDHARVFLAIHFDGSPEPCASGASTGYPATTSPAFVAGWRRTYDRAIPFRDVGVNISSNEEHYYGFRKSDAAQRFLVEYGEITCPAQAAWLRPRLRDLGALTGRFIAGWLHR